MTNKVLIYIVLSVTLYMTANGQESITLPLLDFNADTRSAGMGETTMGESMGMYLYANPTSFLFGEQKIYGTYNYGLFPDAKDFNRLNFHAFSAGYRLKNQAFLVGFRAWNGLSIPKVGEDGIEGKKIKPVDMSVDIGYSRQFGKNFSAFFMGSYIYSYIGKTANTAAASGGVYYRNYFYPSKEELAYCIGVAFHNLGGKVKYAKESYDLPASVDLGGSLSIAAAEDHIVNVALSGRYLILPSDASTFSGGVGAEYEMFNIVSVRAGYHFGRDNNYATFGLGGRYKMVDINASYHTAGKNDYGNKWRFGIGVRF